MSTQTPGRPDQKPSFEYPIAIVPRSLFPKYAAMAWADVLAAADAGRDGLMRKIGNDAGWTPRDHCALREIIGINGVKTVGLLFQNW